MQIYLEITSNKNNFYRREFKGSFKADINFGVYLYSINNTE